jgi:hypothetical protein
MIMVPVHHGMPSSPRDQPSVYWKRCRPGDKQREDETSQKSPVPSTASIAPGMRSAIALSTISMMVIETVSEANASLRTVAAASPTRRVDAW